MGDGENSSVLALSWMFLRIVAACSLNLRVAGTLRLVSLLAEHSYDTYGVVYPIVCSLTCACLCFSTLFCFSAWGSGSGFAQGEMACMILERQRLRLGRSSSLEPPDARARRRGRTRPRHDRRPPAEHRTGYTRDDDGDDYDDDVDEAAAGGSSSSTLPRPAHLDRGLELDCINGGGGGGARVRGRTRLRASIPSDRTVPTHALGGGGGGRGGASRGGDLTRSLSSPAAPCRRAKFHNSASRGGGFGGSGGGGSVSTTTKAPQRERRPTTSATVGTVQTCFKEERESFIRDLQVLHRQLEVKDRDRARREGEHRAAGARARADVRAAQERAETLGGELEVAAAARVAAEARAEALAEGLDKQASEAEVNTYTVIVRVFFREWCVCVCLCVCEFYFYFLCVLASL